MHEVLKRRRVELGLSQAQLAAAAGVDARQIRRYESGEQQPLLSVAVAVAAALEISVGELAGTPTQGVKLAGTWWVSWQTSKDGEEVITAQEVQIRQDGDFIQIGTTTRGADIEDGGYHWRGELRLWDNEILMGWYAAAESSVRSKGTMYFTLHPHGQHMIGRWVGLSHDGNVMTGLGAMAHSENDARRFATADQERP